MSPNSQLTLNKIQYRSLVEAALGEDIGQGGDITSKLIFNGEEQGKAVLNARGAGVLAGADLFSETFLQINEALTLTWHKADGDALSPKDQVCTIEGTITSILTAERVALNFLGHMSGIASLTARYVAETKGTQAKIAATRKTTPLLRGLEKYAVQMGGGLPHRFRLDDGILIKDNHIALKGGIDKVLDQLTGMKSHVVKVEVEVDTLEQLKKLFDHKIDIVLLDNMAPETLKRAVDMVNGRMICEASGGVTLKSVQTIAQTGVDIISVGALTHSAPCFDFGLDIDA